MRPGADPATPVVGLFGLGNMGEAVASRLVRYGRVIAHDPATDRAARAAERHGVELAPNPGRVSAPVVVLSLPSPAVSHAVVEGLVTTLQPGSVVVETSTVNPGDARAMGERLAQRSIGFVDAAVLSGVSQMRDGSSSLLIGGSDEHVALAQPVLDAMARRQRRLGGVGAGMAAKVINNAVAHAVMVVLVEAGAMATANGVSGRVLAEVLAEPDAGLIRPLTHRYAERVLDGDYDGGMPTEAARKDSTLALALAQQSQVPLFAIHAAHAVYEIAMGQDLARLDYASIARLWESWTGRSLAEPREAEAGP
jgi:3-hydroxyisobutyrate dehydrogenase-like beta-hydroxyacid dehydrogenase